VKHIPNYFCRFDLKKNEKDDFLQIISELRRNHAKRPENKCTFITLSPCLFVTCRGEKYTFLYNIVKCTVINSVCALKLQKTLTWNGGPLQKDANFSPMLQVNCSFFKLFVPTLPRVTLDSPPLIPHAHM
jgi:hypothetical protein